MLPIRRADTKIIVPLRNMEDCHVSLYHHMMGVDRANGREISRPWTDWFKYQLQLNHVRDALSNILETDSKVPL